MRIRRSAAVAATTLGVMIVAGMLPATLPSAGASGAGGHRAPKPVKSLALVSVGDKAYGRVTGLTGGTLTSLGSSPDSHAVPMLGTAISPSGTSALIANNNTTLSPLYHLNTTPTAGAVIDLSGFGHEGGFNFDPYSEGVAIANNFALVAMAEKGLVQLRQTSGHWQVDTRVKSPGLSEAGTPHAPGFIRFADDPTLSNTFYGVAVSSMPLKNGKYLALAIDRGNNVIEVIEGVGTAHPKAVAQLQSTELSNTEGAEMYSGCGNGGMAFSPATATRAVITTGSGLDVLDLSHPAHPKLLGQTVAVLPGQAAGLAIAPDGDHVALAANKAVDTYTGLLHANGPLTFVKAVTADTSDFADVLSLAFTSDGTLVVNRAAGNVSDTAPAYYLSLIKGAESSTPSYTHSVPLAGAPGNPNTLSVIPALTLAISPLLVPHGKVGHHFAVKLSVSGGIGHYTFALVKGHLPRGLHRHGAKIAGSPKHPGTAHLRIRATNQYGGAVFRTLTLKVRHK